MVKGLVSVIIPVYNARKYLDTCLDSLLGQSYAKLEIILVNDGSRDDSLALCWARARQDARIMVIDQPNTGPGAARNAGLEIAKGEYVLFSDSDDIVLPGAVEIMVGAMWDDRDLRPLRDGDGQEKGQARRGRAPNHPDGEGLGAQSSSPSRGTSKAGTCSSLSILSASGAE